MWFVQCSYVDPGPALWKKQMRIQHAKMLRIRIQVFLKSEKFGCRRCFIRTILSIFWNTKIYALFHQNSIMIYKNSYWIWICIRDMDPAEYNDADPDPHHWGSEMFLVQRGGRQKKGGGRHFLKIFLFHKIGWKEAHSLDIDFFSSKKLLFKKWVSSPEYNYSHAWLKPDNFMPIYHTVWLYTGMQYAWFHEIDFFSPSMSYSNENTPNSFREIPRYFSKC